MINVFDQSTTCIYCGQTGNFTDEHLFPAGLGGDDRRFLLKNLVCGHCNTEIFSKLETAFMRNSPAAIGRIFLQAKGRGKGKNASIPSIETRSSTVFDPDGNLMLEVELQPGGEAVVLPQAILRGTEVLIRGANQEHLLNFFAALKELLSRDVTLIEKSGRGKPARFRVTSLILLTDRFESEDSSYAPKPPHQGLWRAEFHALSGTESGHQLLPTLFRRSAGQLVFRTLGDVDLAALLTQLRTAILPMTDVSVAEGTPIEQPSVNLNFSMDINAYSRVLAKIGVNISIWVLGESVVRDTCFDNVKRAILDGSPNVYLFPEESTKDLSAIFSSVPHNLHALALLPHQDAHGKSHLVFMMRLYGAAVQAVLLAENVPIPATATLPAFFTIDFTNHRIIHLDPFEFVRDFPPDFGASFPKKFWP